MGGWPMPHETTGDFVLFNNKKRNDKSPDFTGYVTIHGVKRRLSGWIQSDGRLSGTVGELVDGAPNIPHHPALPKEG